MVKELLAKALRKFRKYRVMTLAQLEALLSCSQRTVQRYLRRWSSIRSYNQNGRYYALPDAPLFDRFGIWKYRGICFSKYGNLKETVIYVIENSTAGMNVAELSEILGVNAHSFMSQFGLDPRLQREKHGGRFTYFCAKMEVGKAQRHERQARETPRTDRLPSNAQAVTILVCFIKNPDATMDELVEKVQKEHRGINRRMVECLIRHHGLVQKKTSG